MGYRHPANSTPAPLPATPGGVSAAGREDLEHQALLRVAAAAAGASHVEDVLELAAEEARVALGAASLSVSRYQAERNEIRTLINVGDLGPGEVRFPESETYPAGRYPEIRDLIDNHTPYFNDADDPRCDPLAAQPAARAGQVFGCRGADPRRERGVGRDVGDAAARRAALRLFGRRLPGADRGPVCGGDRAG